MYNLCDVLCIEIFSSSNARRCLYSYDKYRGRLQYTAFVVRVKKK